MAVDHFEEVYAESLTENVTMEFGPEFAEVVDPESPAAFTRPIKVALVEAAKRRVQERETFETTIGSEAAAVETARCELDEMVGGLADPVLPSWYRPEFAERLEEIARTRQSTIRTRRSVPRADGHDLCAYLYEDEDWTYPVLTAVTRLRDSVVI